MRSREDPAQCVAVPRDQRLPDGRHAWVRFGVGSSLCNSQDVIGRRPWHCLLSRPLETAVNADWTRTLLWSAPPRTGQPEPRGSTFEGPALESLTDGVPEGLPQSHYDSAQLECEMDVGVAARADESPSTPVIV